MNGNQEYDLGIARILASDQRKIDALCNCQAELRNNVKALRAKLGLSLKDVAEKAGISKAHVWDIEQGLSGNPRLNTIIALSKALGVTVDGLLGLNSRHPS